MKILAPIRSLEEVEMLLTCGADELYGGITPVDWQRGMGQNWWMNRRDPQHANLGDWGELARIVEMAHEAEVAVFITLNAPFYPSQSLAYMTELGCRLTEEVGVDGLIVADVNLIRKLADQPCTPRIHLSSLGSCFNARSAAFFESLGVRRIILPRQLRLSEIRQLVHEARKLCRAPMEFEVFALNDGCVFEEGFCQTTHALGPFCLTPWEAGAQPGKGDDNKTLFRAQLEALHRYRWFQNNCGSSYQAQGLPNGPCSLCWFGHFRQWGVTAVKVVGREAAFYRKMRSLQMVKAVVEEVRQGTNPEEIARFARTLRQTPDFCDSGLMCYFRE